MRYIYGTPDVNQVVSSIVVLGNFDGVHLGHQKLFDLAKIKAKETGFQIIALSFYPHPTWVLGNNPKPLLNSREEKKARIKAMGVDVFIEYPFTTEFASISPEEFFHRTLVNKLRAKVIIIGSNYYFGKDKKGDIVHMKELGEKYEAEICAVDTVKSHGITISSTNVRNLILQGDMHKATQLLGHPYTITGEVVHGKALGRTIGFPTANVKAEESRIYPPNGVYATIIEVYNKSYLGITNIGYNPTVSGKTKTVETHIFNFDELIYGETIKIALYEFMRPEKKFNSISELVSQLQEDKETAKNILIDCISSLQV
ncbi:MAG: bifunctional riboflavin kinase/FAD synthetase [Cellulosilyticaceae bacterium]